MMISEPGGQNPAARVVGAPGKSSGLLDEQNLRNQKPRRSRPATPRIGKLVGARYVVAGTFIDFYGTSRDVVSSRRDRRDREDESERMQRDHMFDIIARGGAAHEDASLPASQRQASDTAHGPAGADRGADYYRAPCSSTDRGQKDRAVEMYTRAWPSSPITPRRRKACSGRRRRNGSPHSPG